MGTTRSELRKKAMTILYQIDIYRSNKMEFIIDDIIRENMEIENEFVKEIVYGVNTYREKIDKKANEYLEDWNIDRLDKTGANILRMAIYELEFTDTPEIVVINEAIELAKKYSDDAVRKMINAVLDKIVKGRE